MYTINFTVTKKQFCKSLEHYPHFISENRIYIDGYLFNYLEVKNYIVISTVYLFSKVLDDYLSKLYIKSINKVFGVQECDLKIFNKEILGRNLL